MSNSAFSRHSNTLSGRNTARSTGSSSRGNSPRGGASAKASSTASSARGSSHGHGSHKVFSQSIDQVENWLHDIVSKRVEPAHDLGRAVVRSQSPWIAKKQFPLSTTQLPQLSHKSSAQNTEDPWRTHGDADQGNSDDSAIKLINRVIPTPAQALTIMRVMRLSPLTQHIPAPLLKSMEAVINDLINGNNASLRALSDTEFMIMDQIVGHLLMHAPQRFRKSVPASQREHPSDPHHMFERRHVMMVLRAINNVRAKKLNKIQYTRLVKTKNVLYDLSRGRAVELRKISNSHDIEDKYCCAIIANSLIKAHDALSNSHDGESKQNASTKR